MGTDKHHWLRVWVGEIGLLTYIHHLGILKRSGIIIKHDENNSTWQPWRHTQLYVTLCVYRNSNFKRFITAMPRGLHARLCHAFL